MQNYYKLKDDVINYYKFNKKIQMFLVLYILVANLYDAYFFFFFFFLLKLTHIYIITKINFSIIKMNFFFLKNYKRERDK